MSAESELIPPRCTDRDWFPSVNRASPMKFPGSGRSRRRSSEIFRFFPNLSSLGYRSVLNHCWAAVSLLWIAWCFYWPFYARHEDERQIEAETRQTYNLCVQQTDMTRVACAIDRDAYTKLHERLAWPPQQNIYQTFAGQTLSEALSFFAFLCLFPVVFGYALLRAVIELFLWFARIRQQDVPIQH